MHDQAVLISNVENAILLTINRPEALNALNKDVFAALQAFFSSGYQSYEPFDGVIITGAGDKAFAAGADITEFQGMGSEEGGKLTRSGKDTFMLIERFHRPVIAAVHGFALGGGCELTMACHLRIASEQARFGQPEVNLGLIPGYGGTQRLIQLIGKAKAMELLLTGDMLDAETALRLGLANQVVPRDTLLETCYQVLKKIGAKGPLAIAHTISCVNAYFDKEVDGYEEESKRFGALMDTADFVEGTNAFLEKRKPNFTQS